MPIKPDGFTESPSTHISTILVRPLGPVQGGRGSLECIYPVYGQTGAQHKYMTCAPELVGVKETNQQHTATQNAQFMNG